MNRRLDAYLVKTYPTLFADRHASMRETCMCWGFDVGDGWYRLIKEACDKLEPLCRAEYEKDAPLEKAWYKHARSAIGLTAKVSFVFHLLYKLANWLQPDIYGNPLFLYGGPPRALQVKEKYGTLRFYMTHETEEMSAITEEAERKSAETCEVCGEPGRLYGHGWLYTRCRKCAAKMRARGYII